MLIVEPHALLADCLAAGLRAQGIDAVLDDDALDDHVLDDHVLDDDALGGADLGGRADHHDSPQPALAVVALHDDDQGAASASIASLAAAGTNVIAILDELDLDATKRALDAGAVEVLTTDQSLTELAHRLLTAAHAVMAPVVDLRDDDVRPVRHNERIASDTDRRFALLTTSEAAVLRDLMGGHTPEEISRDRFVAVSTVRSQIRSVLSKLGVNSQLAAVTLAFRSGWQELRKLA